MQRQWLGRTVVGVTCVALLAAGCGGDDDEAGTPASGNPPTAPATTEAPADPAAYCEAEAAIETAPAPDTGDAVTDEEVATAVQAWATDTLQPLVAPVVAAAPEEIDAAVDVMADAIEEVSATGDATALQSPDFLAAADEVHAFDLVSCGWETAEVTATEYRYEGLPDELVAGVTSFELDNLGSEPHELRVFRKADGVTTSAADLLALPDDELAEQAEMVSSGAYADPNDEAWFVAELTPGDYFATCFVPVGATGDDAPPDPDGPLHHDEGMVAEFTVG